MKTLFFMTPCGKMYLILNNSHRIQLYIWWRDCMRIRESCELELPNMPTLEPSLTPRKRLKCRDLQNIRRTKELKLPLEKAVLLKWRRMEFLENASWLDQGYTRESACVGVLIGTKERGYIPLDHPNETVRASPFLFYVIQGSN